MLNRIATKRYPILGNIIWVYATLLNRHEAAMGPQTNQSNPAGGVQKLRDRISRMIKDRWSIRSVRWESKSNHSSPKRQFD
jgi:hypothetical protein